MKPAVPQTLKGRRALQRVRGPFLRCRLDRPLKPQLEGGVHPQKRPAVAYGTGLKGARAKSGGSAF